MLLPFTLGPVTVIQDEPSMLSGSRVPVKAECSKCGASFKSTADPDDEVQLRTIANRVMSHFCPANGHGSYMI